MVEQDHPVPVLERGRHVSPHRLITPEPVREHHGLPVPDTSVRHVEPFDQRSLTLGHGSPRGKGEMMAYGQCVDRGCGMLPARGAPPTTEAQRAARLAAERVA